jgi:tRNA 2-selenouridine synthase
MVTQITIPDFFKKRVHIPLVDVRSPAEFSSGHIPGAVNIPLFTDEERALVGTSYKQKGRQHAIKLGLNIVGPKMLSLAEMGEKTAGKEKQLLVHCWRGGMRSENMAWLFSRLGISCYVLQGGYKSYRIYGRSLLKKPMHLLVVGGMTGSGKTDILRELAAQGEQVVDLEGLANHKGSAFGNIGQHAQHENEHFENLVFEQFHGLDLQKPIWLEDESKHIGRNYIPDELFWQMRNSPVLKIDLPKRFRIRRLVEDYSHYGDQVLKNAVLKIDKRLGVQNVREALEAIGNEDYLAAADIILTYYDKAYSYGLNKRNPATIFNISFSHTDIKKQARELIDFARSHSGTVIS